ncbi:MAG: ATP-binding protein [Frankiaceae bacterium]
MSEEMINAGHPPRTDPSIRSFEDRHIDGQMRALIVRFARLVVLLTLVTAPFVAPRWERTGWLVGDALVALVVIELAARTRWLERARPWQVYALLALFVVQISAGAAISQRMLSYGLLELLPIVFAAAFFDDVRARYSLPFVATAAEVVATAAVGQVPVRVEILRLLCFLLAAHFGAAISDVLREALRSHRSLHSVLEAATESVDEQGLADRGLKAALSVAAWDAGAVALTDPDGGDGITISAMSGVSPEVEEHYLDVLLWRGDGGFTSEVLQSGRLEEAPDAVGLFGTEHPLVRDGIAALAATPIPYLGEPIGVLLTFHRATRVLDDRERDRLTSVAEQLGLALGSARAHRREAEVATSLRELNRRKDAFLAAVSHELRTPATTIELAARTLQRAGDRLSPEERTRVRGALVARSRDLRELIEALLDVALTESGESRLLLEPVSWVEAVRRWVAELEERLGRPIKLLLPEQEIESNADPAKIERVLFALVSNAVKFSMEDTPVTVELRTEDRWVVLAVTDEGMGILPGDVERIFDRFLQLDDSTTREAGGLGIGLTLVRHFTRLHAGRVEVASKVGEGSTFTVRFPLLSEPA